MSESRRIGVPGATRELDAFRRSAMFELPELVTIAKQMNDAVKGKRIRTGRLGSSPHKFIWYNRSHDEFERLTIGKQVGGSSARGKWLFVPLEPGYVLCLGECGGKVVFSPPGSSVPEKYHLYLGFEDMSFLTATTRMWAAMELHEQGKELQRELIKGMRATPIDAGFRFDYFCSLIDEITAEGKRSAKGFLTQDQIIPGLGNAIAQDILFRARLHPRHPMDDLGEDQKRNLYDAIIATVTEVTEKGGDTMNTTFTTIAAVMSDKWTGTP